MFNNTLKDCLILLDTSYNTEHSQDPVHLQVRVSRVS